MSAGYMQLAAADEEKGAEKAAEMKCGDKMKKPAGEGKCSDAKCGEGKCAGKAAAPAAEAEAEAEAPAATEWWKNNHWLFLGNVEQAGNYSGLFIIHG